MWEVWGYGKGAHPSASLADGKHNASCHSEGAEKGGMPERTEPWAPEHNPTIYIWRSLTAFPHLAHRLSLSSLPLISPSHLSLSSHSLTWLYATFANVRK